MKKIILIVLFFAAIYETKAQSDPAGRDSLANSYDFQLKVRQAAINTSYSIIEANVADVTLIRYGQLWIAQPKGGQITAMSYGVLRNPAIDGNSSQDQIQQEVGNIYVIQGYAWYLTPPPPPAEMRILNNVIDRRSN